MNRSITRLTRKILSLALLSLPLSLLVLSACGGGGSGGVLLGTPLSTGAGTGTGAASGVLSLVNGQAATVVIGQPNFTSSTMGWGATGLANPYSSVSFSGGQLYVPDYGNNRTLVFAGIPTTNGASAAYAIGETSLTSFASGASATVVYGPQSPVVAGTQLFAVEYLNNRVDIYSPVPGTSPGTISVVVGQPNNTTSACAVGAAALCAPETVSVAGGKMVVADGFNNRVLIWNSIPTVDGTPANLVLGQTGFNTFSVNASGVSASSMNYAGGAWTDGTRVVVLDQLNNRVLIWNTFPTTNGQPADLVLGQPNFTSNTANAPGVSASSLKAPYEGVFVDSAGRLFVTDTGNNRVLVWNTFPTTNGQPADVVLGQATFTTSGFGTSATTLNNPVGVYSTGTQVFVTDRMNNRVLVY